MSSDFALPHGDGTAGPVDDEGDFLPVPRRPPRLDTIPGVFSVEAGRELRRLLADGEKKTGWVENRNHV